ncbi:MAG: 50S ribosomal protein L17 [Chthoniobacterales bacterium]
MRHRNKTVKLGRTASHRNALLANQVCSLIQHHRIKTTLAKAKAVRPLAEKMVTLGKRGDLHARRTATSYLKQNDAVKKLFSEVAPAAADREGGYTRIIKLGPRPSDSAPMALIEWVDLQKSDEVDEIDEALLNKPEPKKAKAKSKAKPKAEKESAKEKTGKKKTEKAE